MPRSALQSVSYPSILAAYPNAINEYISIGNVRLRLTSPAVDAHSRLVSYPSISVSDEEDSSVGDSPISSLRRASGFIEESRSIMTYVNPALSNIAARIRQLPKPEKHTSLSPITL